MFIRTYASSRVKRKSFYRKSDLQMFLLISTQIWRLHTKLYNGAWNVSANNSESVDHMDLRLGQIVDISVFYTGLLIDSNFARDKFAEKSADFAVISREFFFSPKKQSVKNGRFCGSFLRQISLEINRFCANQTSVFNVFLTEVICSFNNNMPQKWTNGKAFNIMASAQFFAT